MPPRRRRVLVVLRLYATRSDSFRAHVCVALRCARTVFFVVCVSGALRLPGAHDDDRRGRGRARGRHHEAHDARREHVEHACRRARGVDLHGHHARRVLPRPGHERLDDGRLDFALGRGAARDLGPPRRDAGRLGLPGVRRRDEFVCGVVARTLIDRRNSRASNITRGPIPRQSTTTHVVRLEQTSKFEQRSTSSGVPPPRSIGASVGARCGARRVRPAFVWRGGRGSPPPMPHATDPPPPPRTNSCVCPR